MCSLGGLNLFFLLFLSSSSKCVEVATPQHSSPLSPYSCISVYIHREEKKRQSNRFLVFRFFMFHVSCILCAFCMHTKKKFSFLPFGLASTLLLLFRCCVCALHYRMFFFLLFASPPSFLLVGWMVCGWWMMGASFLLLFVVV